MTSLRRQPPKQGIHAVKERKKHGCEKEPKFRQKIRLIYSDPDATDSSSDDEDEKSENWENQFNVSKRKVKEIHVPIRTNSKNLNPVKMPMNKRLSRSGHKGIRQQKWGKWAAEIRDPIRGCWVWFGTYKAVEDAAVAYEKKKLEFESIMQLVKCPNSSNAMTSAASRLSPSSVLDVSPLPAETAKLSLMGSEQENGASHDLVSGFGSGLDGLFDELRMDDFPVYDLGFIEATDLTDIDIDLGSEELDWLDEALNIGSSL
ncbi:hypothetical protein Nepgr_025196 [Nepenthes gracilis]|uniref:AP2/ERF domain-containing protein n=1 Tax=Nepenthes gracilis TaxID=150966 RepID=A0AAD3XZG7_NEPGR|nr:hypothetical protein Nepgr_025196 [Nepenthes gracilis]